MYGFDEGEDPILIEEFGADTADHEANVYMLDDLKCVVREEDKEYGHGVAVQVFTDALRLEGLLFHQALQVVQGDLLHVEAAPWRHEADVPRDEAILAREHLVQYGLLALDDFLGVLKLDLGHLQREVKY